MRRNKVRPVAISLSDIEFVCDFSVFRTKKIQQLMMEHNIHQIIDIDTNYNKKSWICFWNKRNNRDEKIQKEIALTKRIRSKYKLTNTPNNKALELINDIILL